METVFNILVIGFILLIAYWWANQGLFSAILHLVCVFAAGVLAFATWEPIAGLCLSQDWLVPYAWGVALLLPFAIYLFILRVAADKLAPDNLNFPQVVNLGAGGVVGLAAAILTVGITLIGVGHTHSTTEILGVKGVIRTSTAKGQPDLKANPFWVPAHDITAGFFSWVSEGSMTPTLTSPTLASMQPDLGSQSFALVRDTFVKAGRLSRTVAKPGSIRLDKAILVGSYTLGNLPPMRAYVVDLNLEPGASDFGQGFAISASQLRLVGERRGGVTPIAYPVAWTQPNSGGGRTLYRFDDLSNYITAPAGTTSFGVTLIYPATNFPSTPKFLHAMGLRLDFPAIAQESNEQDAVAMQRGGRTGSVEVPAGTPAISSDDLVVNDSIMPANANLNNLGAMEVKDTNYLFAGTGEYETGGFQGNKSVVVKGIWAPPNTRVVRLNLTRGSRNSIDFWNDRTKTREEVGEDAELALVDDAGNLYRPIGYLHAMKGGDRRVIINLERAGKFFKIGSYPNLASAGVDDLFALFTPAVGRKIVGVKLGDRWIASSNLDIPVKN